LPKGQKRKASKLEKEEEEDSNDKDLPLPPRGLGVAKTAKKLASKFDLLAIKLF
jgi:hypothetical protein